MALSLTSAAARCLLFAYMIFVSHPCNGYYLQGSYMHTYSTREVIFTKLSSLTSVYTELPFSYYSLPYCRPSMGIKRSTENIGQLLMGDQIVNSPYRFRMNVNESVFLCTTHPLTEHEVKILKQRTRELYQVNMILDNLPVLRVLDYNGFRVQWTGFPVGYSAVSSNDDYIINHLKFRVLISTTDIENAESGYEIVGFEVVPCSVRYEPEKMEKLGRYDQVLSSSVNCPNGFEKSQVVRENERVSFTYEVEFVKTDMKWRSRWDVYLKMEDANHWFLILDSLGVIFVLAGVVFVILLRTVRRDLTRYEELDKGSRAQANEELSGWKLVAGDVFREPKSSKLLCVMIGTGVQITGMTAITVIFSVFGFISAASRGMLLTGMIFIYLFLGIGGGYSGVYLYRIVNGSSEGWRPVSWLISCFFPGIVFVIHIPINFVLWANKSTGAIPISLYIILLSLWFCISVPLTLFGGYLATQADPLQYPVRPNQITREIPGKKYPSWLPVLCAGTLPFGTIFIELFFIVSSIWLGRFYNLFGFLLAVLLFLVIICGEVSIVVTYMLLCVEDWRWWWSAFYGSGSVSVYVFLYFVYYLVFDLNSLSGSASVMVYLGYSLIIAVAMLLSTGAIGFITSFFFVRYLFSSVKIN